MKWIPAIGATLAGTLATAAVAAFYGMSARESWDVASVAAVGAATAGAVGWLALTMLRTRSIRTHFIVVSLTSVAVVIGGAIVAAVRMFLSDHDLHALFVIVAASATVGVVIALVSGIRTTAASRSIRDAAQAIGEGGIASADVSQAPAEFRAIAASLESMSRRLQEARDKERALDASRRELVAWVSHDLRTPLAGIRAVAEALEDRVVSDAETVARYHRTLREEADRMTVLVDDLFELSRINAGALKFELAKVPLEEVVSHALAATATVARAKGVRLESRSGGPSPVLEVSTGDMTRVLRNLLENAIRHTPSDGAVWVEAGADRDNAFVRVADECGGIPEEDIDRVFEMAFRGEVERSSDGGGGLGLAIARGIVEAHKGEIHVENREDGCLFTVTLPLAAGSRG